MKIAAISASTVPSTAANSIQVMKVCQSLAQIGYEVRLYIPATPLSGTPWPVLAAQYGLSQSFEMVPLPVAPALRRYDLAARAVAAARRWQADAAYTWMLQAAVGAVWSGLPALLELHDRITGRLAPQLFRLFLHSRTPHRLLPITRALQRAMESDFSRRFSAAEAVVAPDGVDLERYMDLPAPAEARRRLNLPEGLTAVYTGHFYAGRGMEVLLALARANPQVRFLWVGGRQPDVEAWRERLAAAGVCNVTLTGFVANASLALYQAAGEILLMPYASRIATSSGGNTADFCSPMKLFEYMAAGRAILSSDLPVLREVIDENTAAFVPPDDAEAWQAAFAALAADPARCARLGAAARAAVGQYSWLRRAENALAAFPPAGKNES